MMWAFNMLLVWLLLSYDVACKWSIWFLRRLALAPALPWAEGIPKLQTTYLIPKFHLGSHRPECADKYSFNYTEGVGRMHGEMVETIWAALNWLQYSTREMAAGHRREVISEAMNFWNWRKNIGAGVLLLLTWWLRLTGELTPV